MVEYSIICVNYSDDPKRISYVGLYSKSDKLPTHSRSQVIVNLDAGHQYRTWFNENGKWIKGALVEKTPNGIFITSDPNETTKDNLRDLPSCS